MLLDLVTAAAEARSAPSRLEVLIKGFTQLFEGRIGGFNDVDLARGRAIVIMEPQVVPDPTGAIQAVLDEHPIPNYYKLVGDPIPVRLSDCPLGRWPTLKGHPVMSEVFGPMRTPHAITIPVPWRSYFHMTGSAYVVTRNGRDFDGNSLMLARKAQELLRVLHATDESLGAAGRRQHLSDKEYAVLELYGMGLSANAVAGNLRRPVDTVQSQINRACAKLGITGRGKLVVSRAFGYAPPQRLPADRLASILDS